jgi:hypothetical protein
MCWTLSGLVLYTYYSFEFPVRERLTTFDTSNVVSFEEKIQKKYGIIPKNTSPCY